MQRPMASIASLPGRPVKLFRNGRNQSVRIPRDFELPGTDAVMRKEGERLIIEPAAQPTMAEMLAKLRALDPIEDDWPKITDDDLLPLDDIDL